MLRQLNGFILLNGALHVRGLCSQPEWHSLSSSFTGALALHTLYDALLESDIPFAQDCVADQFILRDGCVYKLEAETGVLSSLSLSLAEFFVAVEADPTGFLGMQPLLQHQRDGGSLQPGQVLHVYPPFCTHEAAQGVSLKAVPIDEAMSFLSNFARQVSGLASGEQVRVKVVA
ncbi:hypothetical protein [Pelomonas sp. KK5]|uniref:hypothetical protein n=1 Tax=Pelomonas sp. KK5 TaxID=1855730 RepID=UPI00117CA70B|nr:hypothetical protein [Pelomonas sp. KK5]